MAISVSDLGDVEDTGNDNQANFTFGSFGAEASDRYLIACVLARDTGTVVSASAVTIGGVSASIFQSPTTAVGSLAVIAIALVPTGSSGDVVVDWSEAMANDQNCTLLRATGLSGTTRYDDDGVEISTTGTSISGTVDWPAGGLVVGAFRTGTTNLASGVTWTGLGTEDSDGAPSDGARYSVAHEVKGSAATGQTITAASTVGANQTARSLAVAVFSASSGYSLAQDGGSFTLTGGTNTLTAQRKLVTSGGSFALTGGDTTFRKGFSMVASGGSYSLTGGDATFPLTRKLAMAGGSFAFSGGDTGLLAARKLVADSASFSLTGGDAALTVQRYLAMAGGAIALTGGQANLLAQRLMAAGVGEFVLTGGDVEFTYEPSSSQQVIWGYRRRKRVKAQPPGKVVYQGVPPEWDDDDEIMLLLH